MAENNVSKKKLDEDYRKKYAEVRKVTKELAEKKQEYDRVKKLEKDLDDLRQQKKSKYANWAFLAVGIFLAGMTIVLYATVLKHLWVVVVGVGFGSVYLLLFFVQLGAAKYRDNQIKEIDNELDLLTLPEKSIEQRAEKLFKGHQIELKKYYDQTRVQSAWILVVGVACIIAGFLIIGATGYFLFKANLPQNLDEKIVTAATGMVAAILTNFIGAIYINMYKGSIESLTKFHERLVTTHHLHFGNFLTAKIKKDPTREATLEEVVKILFAEVARGDRKA